MVSSIPHMPLLPFGLCFSFTFSFTFVFSSLFLAAHSHAYRTSGYKHTMQG